MEIKDSAIQDIKHAYYKLKALSTQKEKSCHESTILILEYIIHKLEDKNPCKACDTCSKETHEQLAIYFDDLEDY